MATRAVYSFTGFPSTPERHLYLHHDGYPTGAAWRFATALRHNHEASAFLTSFLITQPRAEVLSSAEQSADAEYRYQVRLLERTAPCLQVRCWRRLPGGSSWQPRCRPMALAVFIQRFLPGELL
ncbi:hypothetical protein [Synechococcus sp. EJ6-Ellesmere]|uniref:hypothetical protein n=1 Tax=Synechococcus sp. EJ6-Ellesmere TaxID=2823734 RepID=UPI0020CE83D5|nr:hypothetical protein [Synechococcus sp. EJ6-Ellesmere]MCP9825931.1 hypothetical protein [Synechococcus sp. EJ6-Ellesmere]